jgi:hypothetical protein
MYRCEATSVKGFVQQLAVAMIARGYWYYVTGEIPERKDPRAVDDKIISQYGIDISKYTRCRRKRAGIASIGYLRYGRFFVLAATPGRHRFKLEEKEIHDCRVTPIKFRGYSLSFRAGHACVRIQRERHFELKTYFIDRATRTSAQDLERELSRLPFAPFGPIRRQLLEIYRAVNAARKAQGLIPISKWCFRFKPRSVKPFAPVLGRDAMIEA